MEEMIKILDPADNIRNKLDKIIDAFVTFYGEEKREDITKKLSSILYIKTCNTSRLKSIIDDIKMSLFKELFDIPQKEMFHFDVENFIHVFENGVGYCYLDNKTKKVLFNSDDDINILAEAYRNGKYPKVKEFIKKYHELMISLKPYQEEVDKDNEKKEAIKEKYYNQLLSEFNYLAPHKYEEFLKVKDMHEVEPSKLEKYFDYRHFMENFIGILYVNNIEHCFSSESERLLFDPNTKVFTKKTIIDDRVRFLKKIGLDLGEKATYVDYLDNEKFTKNYKTIIAVCDKIMRRKKELFQEQMVEIVSSQEDYIKNQNIVNSIDFVNKDIPLGPFVYESGVSCYHENFVFDGNNYILSPIIFINTSMTNLDTTVIHEMNHGYENTILNVDEKGCTSLCGWDLCETEFLNEQELADSTYEGITRKYELINEYVNDRIALEITRILHSRGEYIYTKRNPESSIYLTMAFLLEKFYVEFKDIIVDSRTNGNIKYLFDMLGEDNFNELNDIVNEFNDKFGLAWRAIESIKKYRNNIDDEDTKVIKDMVSRANQIYAKMHTNAMSNKVGLK